MKIYNKVFSIITLLLLVVTTSCDEFLEEDNRDSLTPENFFTSDGKDVQRW